jgi:hypothetical protein
MAKHDPGISAPTAAAGIASLETISSSQSELLLAKLKSEMAINHEF